MSICNCLNTCHFYKQSMKILSNYDVTYKGFGFHCEMKIVSRHVPKLRNNNSTYVAYVALYDLK